VGVQGKLSRTSAFAILALSLTLPVAAQSGHTGALDSIKIYNFARVNPAYYRGGQPAGKDWTDLASLGIKTIIDLQADGDAAEPQSVQRAGMKYVRIGMTTRVAPTREKLQQFLQLVNDPANHPVYVHCAGGRHRTGVMTAVYRMTNEGWTADQAFKEMKKFNFGPDFLHPEFKRFVYAFKPAAPAPSQPGILATGITTTN
jgi:protein tyrosine/serine phosphatase